MEQDEAQHLDMVQVGMSTARQLRDSLNFAICVGQEHLLGRRPRYVDPFGAIIDPARHRSPSPVVPAAGC